MTNFTKPPDKPQSLSRRLQQRLLGGGAGKVFRGMATLATGSVIARLIGVAVIPILTRLYSPADFGVLAVFTALVAISAPLVTLRYPLALPLPRHDGTAFNLLVLSSVLMLALTAGAVLLLAVLGESLLDLLSMQVLAPWWWLIGLGILATACYEILTDWATRKRAYKVIAITNVWQSSLGSLVKLALGFATVGPLGLLLGQVAANSGGIGRLLRRFMHDFRKNWRYLTIGRIKLVSRYYRGFPLYRVPSQLLLTLSTQAPAIGFAYLYSPATTGQLSLAMMLLALPVNMIATTAGKALYAEAAEMRKSRSGNICTIAKSVQIRLFGLGILPAIIIYLYSHYLFRMMFGAEWDDAGRYASVLVFAMLFQFAVTPVINLLNILTNQSVYLIINVLRVMGIVIIFIVAKTLSFGATETITLLSCFLVIFYGLLALVMDYLLRRDVRGDKA